jgi:GEVED domain/Secretion system C-terminal sorting domain
MKKIILFLLLSNAYVFGIAQGTLTATYTIADIPTNYNTYSNTCNGAATTLSITLPTGNNCTVTNVAISYTMQSLGAANKSEQRSQISFQNTNTTEATEAAGTGSGIGTVNYSRNATIANGVYLGGTALIFEMQAKRTVQNTAGCNTSSIKVNVNTWIVTVTYTQAATPTNACTPIYTSGCSNGDYLAYFSLKGEPGSVIYNQTDATCSSSPLAYSNFTATFTPVNIARGNTYSGFMKTGNANDYATIWIDQDNDDVYEDNERIMNNLKIGTTKLLYGIYIPQTFSLGLHKLRVRIIQSASRPTTVTNACTTYTYGETEDYVVNIINTAAVRNVAPGTVSACSQGSLITIDTASNNVSIGISYLHILDSSNNYIIGLNPGGGSWGTTEVQLYIHSTTGNMRDYVEGGVFMDRHFFMRAELNPVNAYDLKYYYKTAELSRLISWPFSGVTSQFDLKIIAQKRNNNIGGPCPNTNYYLPVSFGAQGADKFLICTGLSINYDGFFLGGFNLSPICVQVSFLIDWADWLFVPGSQLCQSLPFTTLPIQLLSFTGNHLSNNTNKLEWATASEQNNKGFIIQRSTDAANWQDIGFVASNNSNSNINQYYTYIDNILQSNINYYRLKQIDRDNKFKLTMVIKLVGSTTDGGISIYPNPVNDKAAVTIKTNIANNNVQLTITDMAGRIINTQKISINAGTTAVPINLATLAKGHYILCVISSTLNEHYKFIKN